MPEPTELVLVRHGETAWNRARRIQGHTDIPLSAAGRAQAHAVARRLAGEAIDAVVSSDLARARQTAEAIAQACGREVALDVRLRERAYGLFEGRDHVELRREHADSYARWLARDPAFELPGGGESLLALSARVGQVLRELAARHSGGRVVVVAHGGVLDAARRLSGELALQAPRTFDLLNASLNRLRTDGERFEVTGWGDVAHLAAGAGGVGPAGSLDDVEPDARTGDDRPAAR